MNFFGAKENRSEYVKVELTSSSSSSNITRATSETDTNVQSAVLIRTEIEDMIKKHRPKSEKEIRAEGDNRIRFYSTIFIFFVIAAILTLIIFLGVKDGKLPDFANNLMALMTTLVGGIGGFIYGTKK